MLPIVAAHPNAADTRVDSRELGDQFPGAIAAGVLDEDDLELSAEVGHRRTKLQMQTQEGQFGPIYGYHNGKRQYATKALDLSTGQPSTSEEGFYSGGVRAGSGSRLLGPTTGHAASTPSV